MDEWREIEAIKQLKYRYLRFLDTKAWDDIAGCFTEDAVSAYDEGKFTFEGRDKIVDFLRNALGRPTVVTLHHVHHPEIAFTSDTTATGVWYLEDMVIDTEGGSELRGAAFYHDEYVKLDGEWKLRSTGYRRTFEEVGSFRDQPSRKITRTLFSS